MCQTTSNWFGVIYPLIALATSGGHLLYGWTIYPSSYYWLTSNRISGEISTLPVYTLVWTLVPSSLAGHICQRMNKPRLELLANCTQ